MARASEYRHIAAWGKMLGSYDYYIESQQRCAEVENAPLNAIYRKDDKTWVTVDDVADPEKRSKLNQLAS